MGGIPNIIIKCYTTMIISVFEENRISISLTLQGQFVLIVFRTIQQWSMKYDSDVQKMRNLMLSITIKIILVDFS